MNAIFAAYSSCTTPARVFGRGLLKGLAGLLATLALSAQAWTLDNVAELAKANAQQPFKPPSLAIPVELTKLDYDGYRDIRFNTDKALWRSEQLPYEVNFFHVGPHGDSVRINEIAADKVKRIPYRPADISCIRKAGAICHLPASGCMPR
jgi:glucans biosynthesis protein